MKDLINPFHIFLPCHTPAPVAMPSRGTSTDVSQPPSVSSAADTSANTVSDNEPAATRKRRAAESKAVDSKVEYLPMTSHIGEGGITVYRTHFLVHVRTVAEEGLYSLFFHNCLPSSSINLNVSGSVFSVHFFTSFIHRYYLNVMSQYISCFHMFSNSHSLICFLLLLFAKLMIYCTILCQIVLLN